METIELVARPTLSVCLIVKNEESVIGRALASVQGLADEIIVIDTGSTDNTVAIAASYGAQVFHHPWSDDFSAARNAGLERVSCDWILVLDADERVSAAMADRLPEALRNERADAYLTRVVNYENGVAISAGAVVRLFRNRPQYRFCGRVHEQISTSIIAAGGTILPLPVEIQHFGYTASEDVRKNRRERNLRLLQKAIDESDGGSDLSYFLGQEYVCLLEYGAADAAFAKAWERSPNRADGIAAAHRRVEIELDRHRIRQAWELSRAGADSIEYRWDSQMLTARLALFEGDYLLAQRALRALRQAPLNDFGHFPRHPADLDDLEAQALWESDQREHALALWEKSLRDHPHSHNLASHWVQRMWSVHGLRFAITRAMRSYATLEVASACVGALLRAGEIDQAAALATKCLDRGWLDNNILYGALGAGQWQRVSGMAETSGIAGAVHLATAAAWFDHAEGLSRALGQMTGSWLKAFEAILAGERLPDDLVWVADMLMVRWAQVGCIPLLKAGGASLPVWAGGMSRAAWLAFMNGMVSVALELALRQPSEPDALEVLGLAAFDNNDYETAAFFLTQRATSGPASVRVYHRAAQSLIKQNNWALARQVLELGRRNRPDSLLLLSEAAG